jgi:hypothetical protein
VRRIVGLYHDVPQAGLGGDHQSGNARLRTIARIARRQDDQKGCVNG